MFKSSNYHRLENLKCNTNIIDLHIHSNYSFGNENGKMGVNPIDILNDFALLCDETERQISFSITDHNNINANIDIQSQINSNPELYKNITYINGCEYTARCESLGTYTSIVDNKERVVSIIPSLHLLAYGFDEKDETLSLYNKIQDTTKVFSIKGNEYAYGTIILTARAYLAENGIKTNFSDFKNIDLTYDFETDLDNVINFCLNMKKDGGSVLESTPEQYNKLKKYILSIDNLNVNRVLDVNELMPMIENAGGYCVLAHPSCVLKSISSKFIDDLNLELNGNKRYAEFKGDRKAFFSYIIYQLANPQTYTNKGPTKGIVGYELFHPSNQIEGTFQFLKEIGEKYNLYLTGGSDSHFDFNNTYAGSVISKYVEKAYKKTIGLEDDKQSIRFALSSCKFVNDVINNRVKKIVNSKDSYSLSFTDSNNQTYNVPIGLLEEQLKNVIIEAPKTTIERKDETKEKPTKKIILFLMSICEKEEKLLNGNQILTERVEEYIALDKLRWQIYKYCKGDETLKEEPEFIEWQATNIELKTKLFEDEKFRTLYEQRFNIQLDNAFNEVHKTKIIEMQIY